MKKMFFLVIVLLSTMMVEAQTPSSAAAYAKKSSSSPKMPTYKVDGKEMTYQQVTKLNTALIESMEVYKGPDAVAKFGAKYKNGLVVVKLKKSTKQK